MSAPQTLQPGDRVTWTIYRNIRTSHGWPTYEGSNHTGVVVLPDGHATTVRLDAGGRVLRLSTAVLRHITPPPQHSNPPPA